MGKEPRETRRQYAYRVSSAPPPDDQALASRGLWTEDAYEGFAPLGDRVDNRSSIEDEKEAARFGTAAAIGWIAERPVDALRLSLMKIVGLWRDGIAGRWAVLGVASAGFFALAGQVRWLFAALLCANTLGVALTHYVRAGDSFFRFIRRSTFSLPSDSPVWRDQPAVGSTASRHSARLL
jgi:hypothetical protein